MDLRLLLALTKYISTVLTAGFGVLGMVVEYKNKKTKKMTKWGKIAIGGIIASGLVSVASQYIDGSIQAKDATKAAEKNENLLRQIGRLQNPVRDVFMTLTFEFPASSPAIQAYAETLQTGLTQFLVAPRLGQSPDPNALASVSAWDGPRPQAVALSPGSPLIPADSNSLMFNVLRPFGFKVQFFEHPRKDGKHDASRAPDLSWGTIIPPNSPVDVLPVLEFDLKTKALSSGIYRVPILPGMLQSRGPIYVPDLIGAEIDLEFTELKWQPGTPWTKDYSAIIEHSKLKRIEMTIGNQLFLLPSEKFKRIESDQHAVFSWMMPADQNGLDALLKH